MTIGPVKVMVAGVVVLQCVAEVSTWLLMGKLMISFYYENQSRVTIVSHEAKKKEAVCNERVSYLHIAPL